MELTVYRKGKTQRTEVYLLWEVLVPRGVALSETVPTGSVCMFLSKSNNTLGSGASSTKASKEEYGMRKDIWTITDGFPYSRLTATMEFAGHVANGSQLFLESTR